VLHLLRAYSVAEDASCTSLIALGGRSAFRSVASRHTCLQTLAFQWLSTIIATYFDSMRAVPSCDLPLGDSNFKINVDILAIMIVYNL
jgi:hypothetical protein